MKETGFDVVIIGAGAAGLMAAWELTQVGKKVAVVEAKDHIGGRVVTLCDNQFELPVETGAEFIHGNLKLTIDLLKKAKIGYYKVEGEIWQKEEGSFEEQKDFIEDYKQLNKKLDEVKEDISISQFIDQYLQEDEYKDLRDSLKNYVEGYYAANIEKASTLALKEEWQSSDDEPYRVEGGYKLLIDYLYQQCTAKGCSFILSSPAKEIQWKENEVNIICSDRSITAAKVIITVSLGFLQSNRISFYPTVDEKIDAVKHLGFGPVIKIVLQFTDVFWKDKSLTSSKNLEELSFIFSHKTVPTWWTQFPKNAAMLTGWLGGPHAEELKELTDKEILQKAISSLSEIFNIGVIHLQQKLKAHYIFNWLTDPYTCGAYAYETVKAEHYRSILKEPILNTLFFAGEGLHGGPEIGTVEAALVSGQQIAQKLIAAS
jgi:monoamine oxidase